MLIPTDLLPVAIKFNLLSSVRQALNQGADINHQNALGQTPLMLAVREGNLMIVEMLLAAGADADLADEDGTTVLMMIKDHDIEIAQAILRVGVNLQLRDRFGNTALGVARLRKQHAISALLLTSGAEY